MSKYWGFRCASHDPPIDSERWLNHGDQALADALVRVRAGAWPTTANYSRSGRFLDAEDVPLVWRDWPHTEPVAWLRQHPHCHVQLVSEYGDVREPGETIAGEVAAEPPAITGGAP